PKRIVCFPEPVENRIGRITPLGVATEFQLTAPAGPRDIVAGLDGNLWFTKFDSEQLSTITPGGVVTDGQKARGGPWGIGRAADGSIWMTLITGNKVGQFSLR